MRWLMFFSAVMLFVACQSPPSEASSENKTAVSSSGGEAENMDFKVKVEGISEGGVILVGTYGDQQYKADSVGIGKDGYAHFKKDEPMKQGLYYALFPDQEIVQLIVAEDQTFTITAKRNDIVKTAQVEGSLENQILYENMVYLMDIDPNITSVSNQMKSHQEGTDNYNVLKEKRDALVAERDAYLEDFFNKYPDALFTKYKMAGQNPKVRDVRAPDGSVDNIKQVYYYRTEFWDNVDFSDDRLLQTPVIGNKLKRYITELTVQHPDSIISSTKLLLSKVLDKPEYYKFFANWITIKYEPTKTTLMDSEAVFSYMIKNYFTYDRAFWSDSAEVYALQLRAKEMGNSLVGQKGPNVKVPDINGGVSELYDLKTPYIIVYMYNPQCEHCMKETPQLVANLRQWKNEGISVYAIALDTDDAEWRQYVREKGMQDFVNVFDPTNRSIYATYYVDNTPEIYVLNPDREIIGKNLNVNQIMTVINRDKARR